MPEEPINYPQELSHPVPSKTSFNKHQISLVPVNNEQECQSKDENQFTSRELTELKKNSPVPDDKQNEEDINKTCPEPPPELRRSSRGHVPVREWPTLPAVEEYPTEEYIPEDYTDAITCSEATKWKLAMEEEYHSLVKNDTWTIVRCPTDYKPISSQWFFFN